MAKFRKKPVVIEAVQVRHAEFTKVGDPETWDKPFDECPSWLEKAFERGTIRPHDEGSTDYLQWHVKTLEGTMNAMPGDWIIRGVKGELYPINGDIFAETYEPAE